TTAGQVVVWEVATGREMSRVIDPGYRPGPAIDGPLQPVVRFQPGETRLAYASRSRAVHLDDWHKPAAPQIVSGAAATRGLAVDGRGRRLAVTWADGRFVVYDVDGARSDVVVEFPREKGLTHVAQSGSGNLLMTTTANQLRVRKLAPLRESLRVVG